MSFDACFRIKHVRDYGSILNHPSAYPRAVQYGDTTEPLQTMPKTRVAKQATGSKGPTFFLQISCETMKGIQWLLRMLYGVGEKDRKG